MTNGDMLDDFTVKPYHGIRWLENRLVWLEQTEAGRFVRHTLERGGRHVSLDVADYDRDGDVDLVVGSFQGQSDVALEVWENLVSRARPAAARRSASGRRAARGG